MMAHAENPTDQPGVGGTVPSRRKSEPGGERPDQRLNRPNSRC